MMGECKEFNVGMIEGEGSSVPISSSNDNNPTLEMIGAERLGVADKEGRRMVSLFQATYVSESKRKNVICFMQMLLGKSLGCQVFPYGSVPLKTYLPDGDIDLTAFGRASGDDTLAEGIVSVLTAEGHMNAEFVITDIQLVPAEVKLVKCIVQNIVVDISVNQIGGLCTLCFLEQADRVIGKNHLFKKSIILIKAWCYYESRILGAHHGLISTYALETLVLYIFLVFHSTLDGPITVLYRFLDYFSTFDWDTYCLSIDGPVRIAALPDISVVMPHEGSHDLVGSDFLKICAEVFTVPSGVEMNSRTFRPKFLNIFDPLKLNNNLGRSICKGNFFRIRSAFAYGARKLGQILMSPVGDIARELQLFFSCTLNRHGNAQIYVHDSLPRPISIDIARFEQNQSVSGSDIEYARFQNENLRCSNGFPVEYDNLREHAFLEGSHDREDLMTSRLEGLRISNERSKISPPRDKEIVHPPCIPPHAPHMYFLKDYRANGDIDENQSENSNGIPRMICSDLCGDYRSHVRSLQHGRWFFEYSLGVCSSMRPLPPPFRPSCDAVKMRDPLPHPFQQFPHGNVNTIHNPMFYTRNQMLAPPLAYGSEEMPKHRGIGTYFPNPNRPPHGIRPSVPNGRNNGQTSRSPRTLSRAFAYIEPNMHDRSNPEEELSQSFFPIDQILGNEIHQPYSPGRILTPNPNGFIPYPEMTIMEPGSIEHHMQPLRPSVPVSNRQLRSPGSLRHHRTVQGSLAPAQRLNSVQGPDRLMAKMSYRLKDEADFPPLSF